MPLTALLSHSANLIQFYFAIFLCQQVCFIFIELALMLQMILLQMISVVHALPSTLFVFELLRFALI